MMMTSRQGNAPVSHGSVIPANAGIQQRDARAFDGAYGIRQIMQGAGGA